MLKSGLRLRLPAALGTSQAIGQLQECHLVTGCSALIPHDERDPAGRRIGSLCSATLADWDEEPAVYHVFLNGRRAHVSAEGAWFWVHDRAAAARR